MANQMDEEGKDRLTSEEFVDLIPHLPFGNLLDIEFFSSEWKRLLEIFDVSRRLYRCLLCNVNQIGQKSVSSHINGKKHLGNSNEVKIFYHPEYTFTKVQLIKMSETIKIKKTCVNSQPSKNCVKMQSNLKEHLNVPAVQAGTVNTDMKSVNEKSVHLDSKEKEKISPIVIQPPPISLIHSGNIKDGNDTTETKMDCLNQTTTTSVKAINNSKKIDMVVVSSGKAPNATHNMAHVEFLSQNSKKIEKKDGSQSKPSVRVVPLVQLQKKPEKPIQSKNSFTDSCATLIQPKQREQKCNENKIFLDGHICTYPKDKEVKIVENYSTSKNISEDKNVGKFSLIQPMNPETKLVKNPLAAKKNIQLLSDANKSQNITSNTDSFIDLIAIENNKQKITFNNNSGSFEPPLKRQKMTPILTADVEARITKPRGETNTSKDKNNPSFAVQSITDGNGETYGFVGVEYVIKVLRSGAPSKYECGLCELVLDGQTMQKHLLGYSHRLKFCEKHFPTAVQQFRQYILNLSPEEHYKVMIPILEKLSLAIEEHHGRCLPFECNERRYNLERHKVLTEVFGRRHASEQRGPTFTHVIDSKQVDELILRKDLKKTQTNTNYICFDEPKTKEPFKRNSTHDDLLHSHEAQIKSRETHLSIEKYAQSNQNVGFLNEKSCLDDETHKRLVERFLKANTKSNFPQCDMSQKSRRDKEERNLQFSKRSHSPSKNLNLKKSMHSSPHIWSSYCRLVDSKLKTLSENFQKYRNKPESHPSYHEEWQKFWHRRKIELIASGKNYRTYDFQPEWIQYFKNRIIEIYDEEFEKLKINIRQELYLPMTNDYLCDPKYFVNVTPRTTDFVMKKVKSLKTSQELTTAAQNFNSLFSAEKHQITTSRTIENHTDCFSRHSTFMGEVQMVDEPRPTLVSVLRLIAAFEEFLGSLGPKIVDLLSKALYAEKNNNGNSEKLLTKENCSVIEIAVEKFKGLVIAGILDTPKERAIEKAILKINVFLDSTKNNKIKFSSNSFGHGRSNISSNVSFQKPMESINEKLKQALLSDFNTNDISKIIHLIEEKIAASLEAQGHTNIDRFQLEQLAAVCVLLEKRKRETGTLSQNLAMNSLNEPLTDTLKKIVVSISSNCSDDTDVKNPAHVSGHGITRNTYSEILRGHGIGSFLKTRSPQGNFENLFSNNDQNQIDSDSIGTPISQFKTPSTTNH